MSITKNRLKNSNRYWGGRLLRGSTAAVRQRRRLQRSKKCGSHKRTIGFTNSQGEEQLRGGRCRQPPRASRIATQLSSAKPSTSTRSLHAWHACTNLCAPMASFQQAAAAVSPMAPASACARDSACARACGIDLKTSTLQCLSSARRHAQLSGLLRFAPCCCVASARVRR